MTDTQLEATRRISKLLMDGQGAAARGEMESLLASHPSDAEIQALAGDVYASLGEHAASYRCYNFAADAFNRVNQADKVLQVQHKILTLDVNSLDPNAQARVRLLTLLVAGEDALLVGQREKAVASFQEAIRQFPNHTVTYQRLAMVLAEMGRTLEAVEQYLTVARAFYSHGIISKALPYFERALELDPSHAEALEALLICLAKEGREGEVDKPLKAAVQHCLETGANDNAWLLFARLPQEVQQSAMHLRAALLLQRNDLEQAEGFATQALGVEKAEASAWFEHMGKAALDKGDTVAAQTYARWATSAQPLATAIEVLEVQGLDSVQTLIGDSDALQKAGELCLAEEMFEEAKQVFERLLKLEPERKDLVKFLNQARAGLGLGEIVVSALAGAPAPQGGAPAPQSGMLQSLPAASPVPTPVMKPMAAPLAPMASPPLPQLAPPPPAPVVKPAAAPPVHTAPVPQSGMAPPPPLPQLAPPLPAPPLPPLPKLRAKEYEGPAIVRTQYEMHLGELLPPSTSAADLDEQLIG